MAVMTILEAAEYFGISKEAIHNRVRRGSLVVSLVDGVKYVDVDASTPKQAPKAKSTTRRTSTKANDERYYKLLEEQNAQLQTKVDKLEGETRTLRDQKEEMLIQERNKIEEIYKDKDEQLKNLLNTISSQFMLSAPSPAVIEEHFEAEIENIEKIEDLEDVEKGELISLKKYLKKHKISEKKKERIFKRFLKKAKKDERIIVLSGKFYIDTIKYDYGDLIK